MKVTRLSFLSPFLALLQVYLVVSVEADSDPGRHGNSLPAHTGSRK